MTRFLCAVVLALSCTSLARAEIVQFTFEGSITDVAIPTAGPFQDVTIGESFTLVYVFDASTPDLLPLDNRFGTYVDAVVSGSLQIDSVSTSINTGSFYVNNLGSLHEYLGLMYTQDDLAIALDLYDSDEFLIESDALPTDFDFAQLDGFFDRKTVTLIIDGNVAVVGAITSFEAIIVPAPSACAMCAIALVFKRRRRLRGTGCPPARA